MQNQSYLQIIPELTNVIQHDPLGCQQCGTPEKEPSKVAFWRRDKVKEECHVCHLKRDDITPPEQRLSSFDVCAGCRLADNGEENLWINGAPSITLNYSRGQGRYWWKPDCKHWNVRTREPGCEKWGPMRTCPMKTEHTVINRPGYLFPLLDAYWKAWRLVLDGKMLLGDQENSELRMYFLDIKEPDPLVKLENVLEKIIPESLMHDTTQEQQIVMARAISLERLKGIMKASRELGRAKWLKKYTEGQEGQGAKANG